MVCWLVGRREVVPAQLLSTSDSSRPFQTSTGSNTNDFCVNQNHHGRPEKNLWLCSDLSILFPTFPELVFGEASSAISCPRSTIDSPRAIQTSVWANRNNFPVNQNRPRHLWAKFKKSNILTFFEIGQVTSTPRGSIGNFHFWPVSHFSWDTIWMDRFEAKDGIIKVERWPSARWGAN